MHLLIKTQQHYWQIRHEQYLFTVSKLNEYFNVDLLCENENLAKAEPQGIMNVLL